MFGTEKVQFIKNAEIMHQMLSFPFKPCVCLQAVSETRHESNSRKFMYVFEHVWVFFLNTDYHCKTVASFLSIHMLFQRLHMTTFLKQKPYFWKIVKVRTMKPILNFFFLH